MLKIKNSLIVSILAVMLVFSFVFVVNAKAQQNQNMNQGQDESTSTTSTDNQQDKKQKGQIDIEEHRGVVATFVQGLLNVADREGGIGEQVRVIAREQNESVSSTIRAVEKVQIRNKVKTFLIGSDYKNLGALRSAMVEVRNRLEKLDKLMEDALSDDDKTELQNQVDALGQERTKIEDFVKAREGKFSLFGWLVKLFNK